MNILRRRFRRIRLFTRRGLLYSLLLSLVILALGGLGFWAIEPGVHSFGDGLWLAFTTAATVGYGDIVPHTWAGRLFAVLVVLLGLGVLSLVTASVAAIFVQTEERQIERDLMQELASLQVQIAELQEAVARLGAVDRDPRRPRPGITENSQ